MRRFRIALTAAGVAVLMLALPMQAGAQSGSLAADAPSSQPTVDRSSAMVRLDGAPLATSSKTKPAHGKKIDFSSATVKSYRAHLAAFRNDFKQWLKANAPKAKVVGQYDIALNAVAVRLHGTSLKTIRSAPHVVSANYEALYHPLDAGDPDLALISAQAAWATAQVGGAADAGRGVKVAIVDTGIDVTHPCFSDAGFPATKQLGDTRFTNNKVIVAKVFNNKTPSRHYTPEALQEHGTHVAGTVACDLDTPVNVDGVAVPYAMSGVAPAAQLGNYNIFPGDVLNARSEDIVDALEAAYVDGMDIDNMSLGGGASGNKDLLAMAVDNLDQAGMISAVAAGNSATGNAVPPHLQAPGHYTIESPGSAARALTAGASSVGHFIGAPFTTTGLSTGLATGDFQTVDGDLTAPVGVLTGAIGGLGDACSALSADLTGDIAVVSRGTCTFSTKIRNAQAAGAVAAIVVNNAAGDPTAMASDGTADQPTIPAYMASLADRPAFVAADGASGTIGASLAYIRSSNDDIMAGFSSQGPTDVSFRVKPDVVAPGVNVLSSIPHQFCDDPPCFAFFQGTSMATPHLAGAAAVVLGAHPDWSAAEVRSAIVNTADRGVLVDSATGSQVVSDVNVVGSGRENLLAAVGAELALDPVSVSFGAIPSGSGTSSSFTLRVTNLTDHAVSESLSIDDSTGGGVTFAAPTTISLAPNETATISVTMHATKSAAKGDHQATLSLGDAAHSVLYVFVK
ncbi:MAG TPA: S8 family serine peptidase [Candidatus Limnocylindrales bacterium]|nr:S8 family serine peptidase [Candidatus Limnocylindrales bacterium]